MGDDLIWLGAGMAAAIAIEGAVELAMGRPRMSAPGRVWSVMLIALVVMLIGGVLGG